MAHLNNPFDTHGRLIAASKGNGATVYNTARDKLGDVYDVMNDKRSGKAEFEFWWLLDIGDGYHPLPRPALTYDAKQGVMPSISTVCVWKVHHPTAPATPRRGMIRSMEVASAMTTETLLLRLKTCPSHLEGPPSCSSFPAWPESTVFLDADSWKILVSK